MDLASLTDAGAAVRSALAAIQRDRVAEFLRRGAVFEPPPDADIRRRGHARPNRRHAAPGRLEERALLEPDVLQASAATRTAQQRRFSRQGLLLSVDASARARTTSSSATTASTTTSAERLRERQRLPDSGHQFHLERRRRVGVSAVHAEFHADLVHARDGARASGSNLRMHSLFLNDNWRAQRPHQPQSRRAMGQEQAAGWRRRCRGERGPVEPAAGRHLGSRRATDDGRSMRAMPDTSCR